MQLPDGFRFRYIERRKKDLEICESSLLSQDYTEIQRVGHRLKGNGVTFGFKDLSSIGIKMEGAALSRDMDKILKALADFSGWLKRNLN